MLPEFVGPTVSASNKMLFGSIYILIFDRHELSIQDVRLRIADCEKVAFHIREPDVFLSTSRNTPSLVFTSLTPLTCIVVSAMERRSISNPKLLSV